MPRTLIKKTPDKVGNKVTLKGWVHSRRDHGKITFIDLKDRTGIIQVVGQGDKLSSLRIESVIEVTGKVKKRPENLVNPDIDTGAVELDLKDVKLLSASQELPLPISSSGYDINEDVRLKHRYLDLRRPRLTQNMRLRSQVTTYIRNWLVDKDFVEIDTPILTKTTPEGARDFLVPSRLQPGNFYALPQSPQQYKQLLMVAGFERYFQFARCFRDEDPRADRAYGEFTQLDMELSFVDQEDILQITEQLFTQLVKEVFPHKKIQQSPWPRISHQEAIEKYGSDKPDLREDKDDPNQLAFAWIIDFPLFAQQTKDDYFYGLGEAKLAPSHHMFTAPHPQDIELLDSSPLKVRGLQHDMVLNGLEVGGGSIRIHQPDLQEKIFELIGLKQKQRQEFEHLLKAFQYGVPPHGGIAPGLDRFLMALLGEPSVRETMAFPTTGTGNTAVMDAPSPASQKQLKELSLKVVEEKND